MPLVIDEKIIEKLGRRRGRKTKRMKIGPPSTKAERELFNKVAKLWKNVLFPATERIKQLVRDGADLQSVADAIEQALHHAEFTYGLHVGDIINRWKMSVEGETRARFLGGLKRSLGVDIKAMVDEPVVAEAIAAGSIEAANLIRSIPSKYLGDVARAVADNFTGTPLPEGRSLLQQIQALSGHTQKRARTIARDQTKKLSTTVDQARQRSIGVSMYVWRTVKDERVVGKPGGLYPEGNDKHGNHYVMEGKYCRWDDPTVYSTDQGKSWKKRTGEMPKTHPGHDIQCRCHSEPVVNIEQILAYSRAS